MMKYLIFYKLLIKQNLIFKINLNMDQSKFNPSILNSTVFLNFLKNLEIALKYKIDLFVLQIISWNVEMKIGLRVNFKKLDLKKWIKFFMIMLIRINHNKKNNKNKLMKLKQREEMILMLSLK